MNNRQLRIDICRDNFRLFVIYYMSESIGYPKLAPYHKQRFKDAWQGYNLYVEWHRESAKSTFLGVALELWKICYNKTKFICNLCYDKRKAKAFNSVLVSYLKSWIIVQDFGKLYNDTNKRTDDIVNETWVQEFVTTNWIKVKAYGMGEAMRWELFKTKKDGVVRPDHIMLDDIDNTDNTRNTRIIDDDMVFLNQEAFGCLSANHQIVRLGNCIRVDGRNPRARTMYETNTDRKIHVNYIYGKAWVTTWDPLWNRYVNTDSEAIQYNQTIPEPKAHRISLEQKKRNEQDGFNQNWLGIPYTWWWIVFVYDDIKRISSYPKPTYTRIWVDPAFSKKDKSDAVGIVVVWVINDVSYIIKSKAIKWQDKDTDNVVWYIYDLYVEYHANVINIETNNWWQILWDMLAKKWCHVQYINATKDKFTRVKEKESYIKSSVYFLEWNGELILQMINFTGDDWNDDDLVDALIHGLSSKVINTFDFIIL